MRRFRHVMLATASILAIAVAAPSGVPIGPATAQSATALAESKSSQRIDNDMAAVLAKLEELGAKPLGTTSVEEARRQPTPADAVKAVVKDRGKDPMALMEALKVTKKDMTYPVFGGGTQPIRVYMPDSSGSGPLPVVVYYHGGGFVIADIDTYESSAMGLAHKTSAIVVSVEYRHAPENKAPAAHEDAMTAYKWVLQNASSFNADPRRIAVAGGNLAANVAIMARDELIAEPLHMLLIYPVAGTDFETPSYREHAQAKPLSKAALEWFYGQSIKTPQDFQSPMLDLVGRANLKGLPPATIINAEIDPLRSEGEMLAQKLRAAGGKVDQETYRGVTHEFFGMNAAVADAERAQEFAARHLKAALAPRPR